MSLTKIKYRGGPMHGQSAAADVGYYNDRIMVRAPLEKSWKLALYDQDSIEPLKTRDGEYVRSNFRLKNGTVIYVWLGWRE